MSFFQGQRTLRTTPKSRMRYREHLIQEWEAKARVTRRQRSQVSCLSPIHSPPQHAVRNTDSGVNPPPAETRDKTAPSHPVLTVRDTDCNPPNPAAPAQKSRIRREKPTTSPAHGPPSCVTTASTRWSLQARNLPGPSRPGP